MGESFIWYNYRKYRAVLAHVVDKHCRQAALSHRRIEAAEKRRKSAA